MAADHIEFYKKQISLTEWLENMGHADATAMRLEDNDKRERLKVLHQYIDLPFDQPQQFSAVAIASRTAEFNQFVKDHGAELCAIRLIPTSSNLPKLRMRGQSIDDAVKWFDKQDIDPGKYRVDFVPHASDDEWATIFVINQAGIFGEILHGSHNKLTQGLYDETDHIITFASDFTHWTLAPSNAVAEKYLTEMTSMLKVARPETQTQLKTELQAKFSHNYLCGYFETTSSKAFGTWFIDYNRILGNMYENFAAPEKAAPENTAALTAQVSGRPSSPGKAKGKVRIVEPHEVEAASLSSGEILVCRMTTPDYLPLMQQAVAIVTDLGGVLSHAAIVARELGKPCITGTGNATRILKTGQTIEVDADAGMVKIVSA